MTIPYFTATNIVLGIAGAIFGAFPSAYIQTVGRVSRLQRVEGIYSSLLRNGELTDVVLIGKLMRSLGITEPHVTKLKIQSGVMFGKKALTEWIETYDVEGKSQGKSLDSKAISDIFRAKFDRNRNRTAFGFIALGYSIQIVGLLLGTT